MTEKCTHKDVGYIPSTKEEGWQCLGCGAKLGFRPDLDRESLWFKITALMLTLQEHNLVYVSNSDIGEAITENVANRCKLLGLYDQYTIVQAIFNDPEFGSHAAYWSHLAAETDSAEQVRADVTASLADWGDIYYE